MSKTQSEQRIQTKKKYSTRINNLADLSKLMAISEESAEEKPQQLTPQEKRMIHSEIRNRTFTIVSLVAYLIGIDEEQFGNGDAPFLKSSFEELEKNKDARIIRCLCRIRAAMEKNYKAISHEFYYNLKNIGSLPELIPTEAVETLSRDGLSIYKTKPDIDEYIIALNIEISNRINQVAALFPEWIRWEYVRPLFIMPGGTKKDGIKKAGELYNSDRGRYPFQCWINWKAIAVGNESRGNILNSDEKFVTLLYDRHEDRFENLSLVRDAGNQTMRNLGHLLENCRRCVIVVDCENSDAVKLAAALSSLPVSQLSKISKILLFDSEYTTDQWKTLVNRLLMTAVNEKADCELEHIHVLRLNQSKSQVDMTLAVRTSREVYTAGVDGVILVSSDSDYWAMIQQLEGIRFLVMLERAKTGLAIMNTLANHDIPFCFIDDFCTAASYTIKTTTLINGIQEQIDRFLSGQFRQPFNIRKMMENALQDSWITMTEKEKEAFYNRYLLHMNLTVAGDGAVSVHIG